MEYSLLLVEFQVRRKMNVEARGLKLQAYTAPANLNKKYTISVPGMYLYYIILYYRVKVRGGSTYVPKGRWATPHNSLNFT